MTRHSFFLTILVAACSKESVDQVPGRANPQPVPVTPWHEEMVQIPAGPFRARSLGCSKQHAPNARDVVVADPGLVAAFRIDKRPATCEAYELCVNATACQPLHRGLGDQVCDHGEASVDERSAAAYCARRGRKVQTYNQWQKAARGPEGWTFASGQTFDSAHACDEPVAAGIDHECQHTSPYGLRYRLMTSFLGEWTRDRMCNDPNLAPVFVDELTQRLDQYGVPLGAVAVRCVDETQPDGTAVDSGAHADGSPHFGGVID